MITYGTDMPHRTTTHAYKTINVNIVKTIIACWTPIFPKLERAVANTIDHMWQTGFAREYVRLGVVYMRQPREPIGLKKKYGIMCCVRP